MAIEFEWDAGKAADNRRKHRVTFEEARSVFHDPRVLIKPDPEHSDVEDRAFALGLSSKGRLLLVVITDREDRIRIISARKATALEVLRYGKNEN